MKHGKYIYLLAGGVVVLAAGGVEEAQSLDAAKARVQSLAELWPGEYVIYDEATGERVSVTAGGKPH